MLISAPVEIARCKKFVPQSNTFKDDKNQKWPLKNIFRRLMTASGLAKTKKF